MRDIRKDLEERIEETEAERAQFHRRIEALDQRIDMLRGMLESEKARWPEQQVLPGLISGNGVRHRLSSPLSQFLVKALADGAPRSLTDLKRRAKDMGVDFSGKTPGRALHFALVGMQQNQMVERLETGEWKLRDGSS